MFSFSIWISFCKNLRRDTWIWGFGQPIPQYWILYKLSQSCSQRPRSFWSATGVATSGQIQHWKSTIHRLPVTLPMPRVKSDKSDWFRSQSIVFTKPFKTGMSLDLAWGPVFQRMTKGTPGDKVEAKPAWSTNNEV